MEEFRKQLIATFNSSDLPFEAKYYILKDVFHETDDLYKKYLASVEANKNKEEDKSNGIQ